MSILWFSIGAQQGKEYPTINSSQFDSQCLIHKKMIHIIIIILQQMRLPPSLFDWKMIMSHLKGTLSFKITIPVDCNTSLNILPTIYVIVLPLSLFSWQREVAYEDPSSRC